MPIDLYMVLLQLHMAVIGVVIAGVIALVQLLNNTKPHRDIRLLIRSRILIAYGTLLTGLLVVLAFACWVGTSSGQAERIFGHWTTSFINSAAASLIVVMLFLAALVWFAQLALKTRMLLDTQRYLRTYIERLPACQVRQYVSIAYADRDEAATSIILVDPFQPIREYIKDTAYKYYDFGTADGLRHFSALFDKLLESVRHTEGDQEEYARMAHYISDSMVEFFAIFDKTASEKRKMDTINLLYNKGELLRQAGCDPSLIPIVRGLEAIAKLSNDDDEIIAAIDSIRKLTDAYLYDHRNHDWDHVAGPFDEICLSVTRITETYYLQKNNSLKTVPIIGYTTGEHQTVTASLVDFFLAYRDLGDRYTDTKPAYYFEAIEGVLEVLFVRLADIVANGQQNIGFNMKYHDLARDLYNIYYTFGIDAVEHSKLELLTLCMSNLRRIIKPAKNFKLEAERQDLANMIVELAAKGIQTFGNATIKDKRTISSYACEMLDKHATDPQISAALQAYKTLAATESTTSSPAVITFAQQLERIYGK